VRAPARPATLPIDCTNVWEPPLCQPLLHDIDRAGTRRRLCSATAPSGSSASQGDHTSRQSLTWRRLGVLPGQCGDRCTSRAGHGPEKTVPSATSLYDPLVLNSQASALTLRLHLPGTTQRPRVSLTDLVGRGSA
jgi:hypothetical protein